MPSKRPLPPSDARSSGTGALTGGREGRSRAFYVLLAWGAAVPSRVWPFRDDGAGSLRAPGGTAPRPRGRNTCEGRAGPGGGGQTVPSCPVSGPGLRGHRGRQLFSVSAASAADPGPGITGPKGRRSNAAVWGPPGAGPARCLILSGLIFRKADGASSRVPGPVNESGFKARPSEGLASGRRGDGNWRRQAGPRPPGNTCFVAWPRLW